MNLIKEVFAQIFTFTPILANIILFFVFLLAILGLVWLFISILIKVGDIEEDEE